MKLYISSDHAGFNLKESVKVYLINKGIEVIDLGCNNQERCDYPDFGFKLGESVVKDNCFGIGICGSGVGISIAANKIKGVRAVNANTIELAKLSRNHNDANILCLGERLVDKSLALQIVDTFLSSSFEGDRHIERVNKLNSK